MEKSVWDRNFSSLLLIKGAACAVVNSPCCKLSVVVIDWKPGQRWINSNFAIEWSTKLIMSSLIFAGNGAGNGIIVKLLWFGGFSSICIERIWNLGSGQETSVVVINCFSTIFSEVRLVIESLVWVQGVPELSGFVIIEPLLCLVISLPVIHFQKIGCRRRTTFFINFIKLN